MPMLFDMKYILMVLLPGLIMSGVASMMVKSAFAACNSAFDAINKAAKQVVEMVETNVDAATKAGEATVAASPKGANRRNAKAAN